MIVLPYEQIEAKFFDSEDDAVTDTDVDKAINEVVDEIDEGEDDEEVEPRKAKIIVPKSNLQ